MKEAAAGNNEYICETDERVWIMFDTLNWANVNIRMKENGGAWQDLKQRFYSFKATASEVHLVFSFSFIQDGVCYVTAYGESGGDRYDGKAWFDPAGPDSKQFRFHT